MAVTERKAQMKANKVHDQAGMMGIARSDSDRLVRAQRQRDLPVKAWFRNYQGANEKQRGVIMSLLRESDTEE